MGRFIIILGYVLAYLFLIWFLTCTKRNHFPHMITVLYIVLCTIPIMNYFAFAFTAFAFAANYSELEDEELIIVKNNWFNRTFLGYYEQ